MTEFAEMLWRSFYKADDKITGLISNKRVSCFNVLTFRKGQALFPAGHGSFRFYSTGPSVFIAPIFAAEVIKLTTTSHLDNLLKFPSYLGIEAPPFGISALPLRLLYIYSFINSVSDNGWTCYTVCGEKSETGWKPLSNENVEAGDLINRMLISGRTGKN